MHGTYCRRIGEEAAMAARFGAPPEWHGPRANGRHSKLAAFFVGCCLAVLPGTTKSPSGPSENAAVLASANSRTQDPVAGSAIDPPLAPAETKKAAKAPFDAAPPFPIAPTANAPTTAPIPFTARDVPPLSPTPARIPLPAVPLASKAAESPPPAPAAINPVRSGSKHGPAERGAIPLVDLASAATRVIAVDLPAAPALPPTAPVQPAPVAAEGALRPVDIAQISDSEVRSLRVPQLHEPGLVPGGAPTLAARIDAMQIVPPPVRLREEERALLLAEAPSRMTLRIGESSLGKIDFRMSDAQTIDVKLSDLLDLLADRYDSDEFERLRNSAAADSYVGFDELRELGLRLSYDPVYDELRISG